MASSYTYSRNYDLKLLTWELNTHYSLATSSFIYWGNSVSNSAGGLNQVCLFALCHESLYFPFFIFSSTISHFEVLSLHRSSPSSLPLLPHLLISLWWIMNNSLHFYHCQVTYEHIHLHTPDYHHHVYSWGSGLGYTHFLVWWPRWPQVSRSRGHHPSPPATNQ